MRAYTEFEATKESLPHRINVNDLAVQRAFKTCSLDLRRRPNISLNRANRSTPTVTRANENPSHQLNTRNL